MTTSSRRRNPSRVWFRLRRWTVITLFSSLLLVAGSLMIATNLWLSASLVPKASVILINSQSHKSLPDVNARRRSQLIDPIHTTPYVRRGAHKVVMNSTMPRMLHVVSTRFMQSQADLLDLAYARMWLFETFCLPSMINQETADDFFWMVMTDPNLEQSLLDRLVMLLEPYPNFYLVLSNSGTFATEVLMGNTVILTGDPRKLHELVHSAKSPELMLHTRLDADDAIHRTLLHDIQVAARELDDGADNETDKDENVWQAICAKLHFEWRNSAILNQTQPLDSGKIRIVHEHVCITPGFTLVRHFPENTSHWQSAHPPRVGHHRIAGEWRECNRTEDFHTIIPLSNYSEPCPQCCWKHIPHVVHPAALRSRTITSAGMNRVDVDSNTSAYDNHTHEFWPYVQKEFGIDPEFAVETSRYLQSHVVPILEDNLRGQCSTGHSCKDSSKVLLQKWIDEHLKDEISSGVTD